MLIVSKYLDESTGFYIIELNKKINIGTLVNFTSIDILSRNSLSQISSDLKELNNIHLSQRLKEYGLNSYDTLENELKSRMWTDSYSKILLSDKDIKDNLTGILFTDLKNELCLNIIDITKLQRLDINKTYSTGGNLSIELAQKHKLSNGSQIYIKFTGISGIVNPQYNGIRTIFNIIDDYNLTLNQIVSTVYTIDPGYIEYYIVDPYFNYTPVDILDIGINLVSKQSIMISTDNIQINIDNQSLVNIDFKKYRFRMVDGLNLITIAQKYNWILEAEIEGAVIGEDKNGLVWYTGIWHCGRWFGGTWYSGEWRDGSWYGGIWYSVGVDLFGLNAKVSLNIQSNELSQWFGGKWLSGIWNSGLWHDGSWYDGTWNSGEWFGGIWNDGIWNNGFFKGGIWVDGIWNNGEFSCDAQQAYWVDGEFNGGDFACGIWYDGVFSQRGTNISRFGTRATNARKAIWYGGIWVNGQFHSHLTIDINGNILPSDYNGYSIWYTGTWNNGVFYGGTIYHINFNLGSVNNCVLMDIPIIEYTNTTLTKFVLDGEFYFNRGDKFWVMDNNDSGIYSSLGSLSNPQFYLVDDITIDVLNKKTTIYTLTVPLTPAFTTPSGNKIVSYFQKTKWNNGIWFNGIFDGDSFNGGIWYAGLFKSGIWGI